MVYGILKKMNHNKIKNLGVRVRIYIDDNKLFIKTIEVYGMTSSVCACSCTMTHNNTLQSLALFYISVSLP